MDEMYQHAVKLLAGRDYSEAEIRSKLEKKFGAISEPAIAELIRRRFLDDRRFIRQFALRKPRHSLEYLRQSLLQKGVDETLILEVLKNTDRPSLVDVVKATMAEWDLHTPLHPRDAARLFRALNRLGYEEDAIREELEPLHG